MKTKIFTFVFNRPDILEYQINSIKKFFKGDFDISVIYDTRDNEYFDEFEKICKNNSVSFYNHVSKQGYTPSYYNAQSIQWALDNLIFSNNDDFIVMLLDHDMFLIDYLNLSDEMEFYDVIGCLQSRGNINYVWPGLCSFKKESVKNIDFDFYPQSVNGKQLDTGGGSYKLLLDENIKFLNTEVEYPEEYDDINLRDRSIVGDYAYELHFKQKFLHFRNACNWHNNYLPDDKNKTELFKKILSNFL